MKTIMILSLAGLVACGGGEDEAPGPRDHPNKPAPTAPAGAAAAAEAAGEAAEAAVDAAGEALGDLDMGELGDALEDLGKELEAAAEEMGKELEKAMEGLDLGDL